MRLSPLQFPIRSSSAACVLPRRSSGRPFLAPPTAARVPTTAEEQLGLPSPPDHVRLLCGSLRFLLDTATRHLCPSTKTCAEARVVATNVSSVARLFVLRSDSHVRVDTRTEAARGRRETHTWRDLACLRIAKRRRGKRAFGPRCWERSVAA